jgi:general nucleoside transport system permease protein
MAAAAPVAMNAPETPSRSRERLANFGTQVAALIIAVSIALLIGSLIILAYHESPLKVYKAVLDFSFGSMDGFARMLVIATPLIFSALAVAVCYKAAMFNIGVEGQYLVAMAVAAWAAVHLGFFGPFHFIVVLVFAMLGGMAYAAIPAVLKVKTGAHEVVTTIMLNGVAISLVAWLLKGPLKYTDSQGGTFNINLRTDIFPKNALAPNLGHYLGVNEAVPLNWLLIIGLICTVLVWFLLKRTRLGYEARAVGSSPGSARAGGISIGAVQIKVFLISGALAGLVGMQQILGLNGYLPLNYEAQLGFTGIAVAFLGQNNPFGMVAAAIMWAVLSRGEDAILIETDVPREIIIILQALLILTVVIAFQVARRRIAHRELRAAGATEDFEDSSEEVAA